MLRFLAIMIVVPIAISIVFCVFKLVIAALFQGEPAYNLSNWETLKMGYYLGVVVAFITFIHSVAQEG